MPLALTERTKLAHVLGMLGSPHQGERDAAALAADRLVRGRGLDWLDVLGGSPADPPISRPGWTPSPSPVPDHMGDLQTCGQRLDVLTAWEREFVTNLAQRRTVSRKQRDILAAIAAKVRSASLRPA